GREGPPPPRRPAGAVAGAALRRGVGVRARRRHGYNAAPRGAMPRSIPRPGRLGSSRGGRDAPDRAGTMLPNRPDTHQKALRINLDHSKYGTFAEIGAGQEVARWFFRVGGAAGTIAKSISAYDMTVSDSLYRACGRYVSRQRL